MGLMKNGLFVVMLILIFVVGIGIVSADTQFRLAASDPVANAQFGRSVAIAGDLVAVGEGGDGAIGAVYIYKRQGTIYVPEGELVYPDAVCECCPEKDVGNCPEFGRTVAIQGNKIFVGARFAPVGNLKAGAVYVFGKQGDSWQLEDKIVSPAPEAEDNFGRALAIQGNLLVVTARKNSAERGAAYVFEKKGGVWIHKANITASDSADGDYFGQSVALKGSYLVIGARNTDPNDAGGFYLFRQKGGQWIEVTKVTPQYGQPDEQYGFAIAIAGDTIAVSARRENLTASKTKTGAVYLYSLKGDSVELITKLTASDAVKGDEFGQSVAFAGDAIAVGAWRDDIGDNADQGSIYLFRQMDGRWVQTNKIIASDGKAGDEFGYSLAALGNRMVTGAHFADSKAGAAYVLLLKS